MTYDVKHLEAKRALAADEAFFADFKRNFCQRSKPDWFAGIRTRNHLSQQCFVQCRRSRVSVDAFLLPSCSLSREASFVCAFSGGHCLSEVSVEAAHDFF